MNKLFLIGHLGQDPELRLLRTSGQPVTSFSVATDETFTAKDGSRQERVQWHNIVVFGKAAETCRQYLKKGRQVFVEGRLQTREYDARDNGGKRSRVEVIASRVEFLGAVPTDVKGTATIEEPVPPPDSDVPF